MKNLKINFCITLLFTFVFLSCEKIETLEKENVTEGNVRPQTSISIEEAKQWFQENVSEQEASSKFSADANSKQAIWAKSFKYRFEFGEAVIVPLNYSQDITPVFDLSQKNKKSASSSLPISQLNDLVVYKTSDGQMKYEILNVIPDYKYLEKSEKRKKNVPFTGFVYATDWGGKLLRGYLYDNGKAVGQMGSNKNLKADFIQECVVIDWYSCPGGVTAPSPQCTYMHTQTTCTTYYSPGSGGGGSYSSGYATYTSGGGSSGYGNFNGGAGDGSTLSPGSSPLQVHSNKCLGGQAIWNLSQQHNSEVAGVFTQDGHLLITQILNHSGGAFNGLIKHNNQAYYYYPINGQPMPPYAGTIQSSSHFFIPISATVHSHTPCLNDGTDGVSHQPGSDDNSLANLYPMIQHWVVGCNAIAQFDNQHANFFNKQYGNIGSTCGAW